MAIEFVVEDGTGLTNSTSYVETAEFRQYWENRGVDYSGKTNDEIRVKLNDAATYIDNTHRYKGAISDDDQALRFPRDYIFDRDGVDLSDSVPKQVKNAAIEIAHFVFEGGDLDEAITLVKSQKFGPLGVTYADNRKENSIVRAERQLSYLVDSQLRVLR